MDFYTRAAQVALILLGFLIVFLIVAGILIVFLSLARGVDVERPLAVFGAIGTAATLWVVVIMPLGKWLLNKIRQNE